MVEFVCNSIGSHLMTNLWLCLFRFTEECGMNEIMFVLDNLVAKMLMEFV